MLAKAGYNAHCFYCKGVAVDNIYFVIAGLVVGLLVGITGVGGGSLMTPILISLLKVPASVAIGTDLLYAAITKFFGGMVHASKRNIDWKLVLWLSLGSIPASLTAHYVLKVYLSGLANYQVVLTTVIGAMLVVTGMSIILRKYIELAIAKLRGTTSDSKALPVDMQIKQNKYKLVLMGMVLGFCVTLSSVGAGAFGVLVLVLLLPQLPMIRVIGSDVAHAVLLTLVAGMGHLLHGNVDFSMLGWLLLGSIPATMLGVQLSSRMPEQLIRRVLGVTILLLGVNFIVHPVKPKAEQYAKTQVQTAVSTGTVKLK